MQINSIEPVDLGKNGQEIAEWVEGYALGKEFATEDDFYSIEGALITSACNSLGWEFVPQNGGLTVYWEE